MRTFNCAGCVTMFAPKCAFRSPRAFEAVREIRCGYACERRRRVDKCRAARAACAREEGSGIWFGSLRGMPALSVKARHSGLLTPLLAKSEAAPAVQTESRRNTYAPGQRAEPARPTFCNRLFVSNRGRMVG